MIRSLKIIISVFLIQFTVVSETFADEKDVKDCFEKINRATFAFNMTLDKVLFSSKTFTGLVMNSSFFAFGNSPDIVLIGFA